DGDVSGVVQVGLLACTNQVDIALEIHWGALDDSVESGGELLRIQAADVEHALDLQRLRDHGANSLWQKGGWQTLEQGDSFSSDLVDIAWFRGEVSGKELRKLLGGVCLVLLVNGVIDSYGVFATV